MSTTEKKHIRNAGPTLVRAVDPDWNEFVWVTPADFKSESLLILIHGFTAHGRYLRELGRFFDGCDFRVLLYNYESYRGISSATESLKSQLTKCDRLSNGLISKNKVFIIAHSMGGLVARALALDPLVNHLIRCVVMLGTPNNGCFPNARMLSYMIEYGEYLTELMPEARTPACLSAKELIKTDNETGKNFIDQLNETWELAQNCPPTMTISGGKRFLEVSKNSLKNVFVNWAIQRMMGDVANDGLVTEESANMASAMAIGPEHKYRHFNSYPYYSALNHTYLKEHQDLAYEILDWFGEQGL